MNVSQIPRAVANLDRWLDTMRVAGPAGRAGYGGPVVHWWQNCLAYTGPGLDWRYEGIIAGYLALWQRTGRQRWLDKATRAGDDLVRGQLPGGNYAASSFELNPYAGGTPHEAAASLGLLLLARALRRQGDGRWQTCAATAERNLRAYSLERLWDEEAQSFRDHPDLPSLVPNKACTLAEALFALAELQGDDELIERYALPTLGAVLALQLEKPARLAGAIAQARTAGRVVEKYFPYYIARCVPALLLAYAYAGDERYLAGAAAAVHFIAGHVGDDGLLPQVVYPRGANRYPQWIAPLGDVLRAAELLAAYGIQIRLPSLREALLAGLSPAGGIDTARHFGAQVSQRPGARDLPDFRDQLPVAGWADKAFRYLAGRLPAGASLPPADLAPYETLCQVRGRTATWLETETEMRLNAGRQTLYRWRKGEPWATVAAPDLIWK